MICDTGVSSYAPPNFAVDQIEDFGIFDILPVDRKNLRSTICCIGEAKWLIFDFGWAW